MTKRFEAEAIIARQVAWSCAAGLLPDPFFKLSRLHQIQLYLLQDLSSLYEVGYTEAQARVWLLDLTGALGAKLAAIAVNFIPGIGAIVGGVSRSALCGASTYALGQVAMKHFEAEGRLDDLDFELARQVYAREEERGKKVAGAVAKEKPKAREVLDKLERLTRLRDRGVISDDDFEAMKQKLLDAT